jgi:hypothetical protein
MKRAGPECPAPLYAVIEFSERPIIGCVSFPAVALSVGLLTEWVIRFSADTQPGALTGLAPARSLSVSFT